MKVARRGRSESRNDRHSIRLSANLSGWREPPPRRGEPSRFAERASI
ncbi:hypothetical protein C882_4145 [Caenispirillum salinarum AK4]|uniref:Uncharacterized protein n=1 Tax=Caenispirillum salinarum AK4 TaxID=1238182 RepID=K9HKC1_9PROT|nr:hypothetical protein C882_4145 [Caenispirillum salinarum AK4]